MNKLKKEYLFFKQQEPNMRTLLVKKIILLGLGNLQVNNEKR